MRLPNADKAGNDYLEVRVTSRIRMPNGVQHDVSDSFVLAGQDATDTLASLKTIHNSIKLILMKAQQEQQTTESNTEGDIVDTETAES